MHIKGWVECTYAFMIEVIITLHAGLCTLLTLTTKPWGVGNKGFGWNTNTRLLMKPLLASRALFHLALGSSGILQIQ